MGDISARLRALHEHLQHQPLTHADSQDMATILEASDEIRRLRNELYDMSAYCMLVRQKAREILGEHSSAIKSRSTV